MDLVAKLSVRVSMSHKQLRMCLHSQTQKHLFFTTPVLVCTVIFKFFKHIKTKPSNPKLGQLLRFLSRQ